MSIKGALVAALTAAAFAAPASANVQVGSSGWQWGNPLPQGNTLRAMSFAGATGYAVGDFGTLLKTTDGGTSWSGLPVGTFQSLTLVQAIDADTVVAGDGCVARRSVDGGASFTAMAFTPVESRCREHLRGMSFATKDVGFLLLSDGSVFATTDGGVQFSPRTALPGTRAVGGGDEPSTLRFTSATTGFAAAGGKIYETLDAGVSWKAVAAPGQRIEQIVFASATRGYAVGPAGAVVRTDDGGQTWAFVDLHAGTPEYTSISCASADECVLSTQAGDQVVHITHGGDGPNTVISPSSDAIYAAAFASSTRVAAVGANGATVRSDDAGATFASVGTRLSGTYGSIRAGGAAGSAFAPGRDGALAKTLDGGRTWSRGNVPTPSDLLDVSFPTAQDGYALDSDGGLFATTNGGDAWRALGTGSPRHARALLAPTADVVLAVGPRGVRRSTDGGASFEAVHAKLVRTTPLSGVTAAGGAIFAWGPTSALVSSDEGETWKRVANPGASARERAQLRIQQVAFSSARTGLLRDQTGRIWRTTDAGRHWRVLTGLGTERVRGLATSSANSAYAVVDGLGTSSGGYLLRTIDGGATWQPQFVVNSPISDSGVATSPDGTDYLLGGDGGLLFSTNGGTAGATSRLTLATKRRTLPAGRSITVRGGLTPAHGGEQVTISVLAPGASSWQHKTVAAAANGTFNTIWRVARGTTSFVAQWAGDFKSAGAGSRTLSVTVTGKPLPKPKPRKRPRR